MPNVVFKEHPDDLIAKKRVTTIFLRKYPDFHFYFCPDCRLPMFKYKGEVVLEVPGDEPFDNVIEVMCKNVACGRTVRIEFKE